MKMGTIALGILLILLGFGYLGVFDTPTVVLGVLAIVAGILIIAGR